MAITRYGRVVDEITKWGRIEDNVFVPCEEAQADARVIRIDPCRDHVLRSVFADWTVEMIEPEQPKMEVGSLNNFQIEVPITVTCDLKIN